MLCPNCQKQLEKTILHNTEVDYCPECLGIWFERDELRQAKDAKDKDLNWLDIELWKEKNKFKISSGQKLCPFCRLPLYEIGYADSGVKIDLCNLCYGVWLDRGEFKKIIDYLKEKKEYNVLQKYSQSLLEEALEVFSGPESFREEVSDFLAIFKLLKYKLAVQHPIILNMISHLPK